MKKQVLNRVLLFVLIISTSVGLSSCGGGGDNDEESNGNSEGTSPIISINGKVKNGLTKGEVYKELGATATDDIDINVTVKISGQVDTSKIGTYKIKYTATDSSGHTSTTYRTIIVELWYDNLFPYQQSKYSGSLKGCIKATRFFSCTMQKLPLIGQVTSNPTEKDILDRVIVSHQWMGDHFKYVLATLPDDMKLLLRSVTAIVIDDDIRPSYYRSATGAIYLDPANLWLSNQEKTDISKKQDYRSAYGNSLSFLEFSSYTRNHQRAFNSRGKLNNKIERSIEDVKLPLARLLYHELAHANDFAPFNSMGSFDKSDKIYNAIVDHWNANKSLSVKLKQYSSLTSLPLDSLAKVRFHGEKATAEEKNMKADYIGALFAGDGATNHYNYSTIKEDFANLVATSMMKYHYNIDFDHAFINKIDKKNPACDDYIVSWGTRNRITNPLVIHRVRFALEHIFPNKNWKSFFQTGIGVETLKVIGKGWCENMKSPAHRPTDNSSLNQKFDIKDFTKPAHDSLSR